MDAERSDDRMESQVGVGVEVENEWVLLEKEWMFFNLIGTRVQY